MIKKERRQAETNILEVLCFARLFMYFSHLCLTKLYYQRDVMNRGNQKIQFVTNIVNNTSVELTGIDLLGNVLFTEWFNFSNLLQIPIFLGFINTGTVSSTISISDLIVSFSVISTALATSSTTSESEIVALTQISKAEGNHTLEKYMLLILLEL